MGKIHTVILSCIVMHLHSTDVCAQLDWIGGGGWRSSSRLVQISGRIGLQALPDREYTIGMERSGRRGLRRVGFGWLGTVRFRSSFYELDKPLSYYPLKPHLPTRRLESAQLFSFISLRGNLFGFGRLGWRLLAGPVLHFHSGNYLSTTTAMSFTGGVPFVLYRLGVHPHPLSIPYWRTQFSGSLRIWKRSSTEGFIDPFVSIDLGDRSNIRYQAVPDDGMNSSEGILKNGRWAIGLLCRFSGGN